MSVANLFEPLAFAHGPSMKNRFMLAPLTNQQSLADGRLSDEDFNWLVMRAAGGVRQRWVGFGKRRESVAPRGEVAALRACSEA